MKFAVIVPANLIELVLTYYFWFSLLERRYNKKLSAFIYFAVQVACAFKSWMLFDYPSLKIALTTSVSIALLFILFKDKWYRKIIIYVVYIGCVIAGECISVIVAKYFFNCDLTNPTAPTMGNYMWQLTAYMLSYSFVLIAMVLLKNKTIDPEKRVTQYLCFYIAIQCMMIFIFTLLAFEYDVVSNVLYIVMMLVLAFSFVLAFGLYELVKKSLIKIARAEYIKKEAEIKDKHFKEIKEQYIEFRKLKHDFLNHMMVIEGLEEGEKLREYVNEVKAKIDVIDTGSYCDNLSVDALVSLKKKEAEKMGIKVNYSVCSLGNIPVSDFDLCTVISNLLDNAIEAAEKIENGFIDMKIFQKAGRLLIVVKNSSDAVCEPYDTTKDDVENHGIGLGNIRDIAEKYEGEAVFKYEDGEFISIVSVNC